MKTQVERSEVKVSLDSSSYRILIGSNILKKSGKLISSVLKRNKVAVISDSTVAQIYLNDLQESLKRAEINYSSFLISPGESSKDWENLQLLVEWLISHQIEREDTVIALGGGVIGDLVGFACAILRRGVSVVQIPTSLLAQVDSSVGGKTGINSVQGKNLIGAFHQPKLVLSDISVLHSLNQRDFLSGYAEVVKYGLLCDSNFFYWLEKHSNNILKREAETLAFVVKKSCEIKARIVSMDEKENGDRALLNLGHTFGHVLEAVTDYSTKCLHGEAVSIGCVLAFKLSEKMSLCQTMDVERVVSHFKHMGMKTNISEFKSDIKNSDKFLDLMFQDKKVKDGNLNLILVERLGKAFLEKNVNPNLIRELISAELNF